MSEVITTAKGNCDWFNCRKKATQIACGRGEDNQPGVYCDIHAEIVSQQEQPEYVVSCPNCGCGFGVN